MAVADVHAFCHQWQQLFCDWNPQPNSKCAYWPKTFGDPGLRAHSSQAPTSFRGALLLFWYVHTTWACSDLGRHSRKALLPSTPYNFFSGTLLRWGSAQKKEGTAQSRESSRRSSVNLSTGVWGQDNEHTGMCWGQSWNKAWRNLNRSPSWLQNGVRFEGIIYGSRMLSWLYS